MSFSSLTVWANLPVTIEGRPCLAWGSRVQEWFPLLLPSSFPWLYLVSGPPRRIRAWRIDSRGRGLGHCKVKALISFLHVLVTQQRYTWQTDDRQTNLRRHEANVTCSSKMSGPDGQRSLYPSSLSEAISVSSSAAGLSGLWCFICPCSVSLPYFKVSMTLVSTFIGTFPDWALCDHVTLIFNIRTAYKLHTPWWIFLPNSAWCSHDRIKPNQPAITQ